MIEGKKREGNFEEKPLRVGLSEVKMVCINPSTEEYKTLLGIDLKEESKATEYLGESKEGNTQLRVDFWFESVKTGEKDKVTFFLENRPRENKKPDNVDEGDFVSKKQYINSVGNCSWASDVNNLPEWFTKKDYRVAYQGEEEFYNFVKYWLGGIDLRTVDDFSFDWKQLMKGNLKEIKSQLHGEFETNFVALLEVKTVDKDGETKNYQSVYNKAFLAPFDLKQFRLVDYSKTEVQEALRKKKPKDLKRHEKFVVNVTDNQFGSKNSYILKDVKEWNPDDFIVASNKVLEADSPEY